MSFHSSRTASAQKDANQGSFKLDGIRRSDDALFDLYFGSAEPWALQPGVDREIRWMPARSLSARPREALWLGGT
jgi:hypothetical protein